MKNPYTNGLEKKSDESEIQGNLTKIMANQLIISRERYKRYVEIYYLNKNI